MVDKKKKEELTNEAKRFFNAYKKEIGASIREGNNVIHLEFPKLAQYSPTLSENLIEFPEEMVEILESSLEESIILESKGIRIRFLELPETTVEKIRNIRAKHLDQILTVEGIVRQASEVRPQVANAKFECPNCGAVLSVLQVDRKFREPSRCSCQWKGPFKTLSKEMVDVQRLVIEESPDALEGGQQPRRINIFLKEDLVDPKMEERTTPGSKIKVFGILKEVPVPLPTGISTRYDIAIEANNIIPLEESFEDLKISEEDMKQILELAADPNLYKRLSQSIGPSIYGFNQIKESVLLQLFGGVKKVKSDGGSTRGDIHILLVGDPGVAKSVLLKFASTIAPKGRYVSGKAATAAGLTAAVVKDEFLKGWSLEAGAMVLSNKGTVCIDEIEKMDEHDRSTMHEAMEQQCYHPDLELTFPNGETKKIGEFVESLLEKNKSKIKKGKDCEILELKENQELLTTDFESIYPTKINKVSRHLAPKDLVKIKLSNGREIIVTPEHPCWITENGEIKTIPARDIRKGEFFPIPAELDIEGEEQKFELEPYNNGPQLAKLIGYHITDGCYELNRGKKTGIQFWNNNKDLIDDYSKAAKYLFNKDPGITKRGNQIAVRLISKKVANFIKELDPSLLEKGKIKKIPKKIMMTRKQDIAILLKAIFDGDGSVGLLKKSSARISLVSENGYFLEQVSDLLLRFSIISSIYKDGKVYRLSISGNENILKFHSYIGFISKHKQERIEKYLRKQKTFRSITDIIPNTSKKIREIFRALNIDQRNDLGNQICMNCHKHRPTFQRMLKLVENKLNKALQFQESLKSSLNGRQLKNIRESLKISRLSIIKEMGLTDYSFMKVENSEQKNKTYQKILNEKINLMISKRKEIQNLKKLAFGKIKWSKIKSVEIIKNKNLKYVYDVTINPTHSFVSNGMILHNSVTISKANIHATLRAETTVLAAGNPKMGRFDPYTPIPQQIDISPALLSRFDVIFVIRDLPNKTQDEAIANHVLEEHQQEVIRDIIDPKLLRKYIAYAKQKVKPKLTAEAADEIKTFYITLRNRSVNSDSDIKPIPITARQLEGIIRLSESHAKMRLSNEVTRDDAKKAIELLKISLTQVGYDEETQTFDIDKMTTGITSSKRGKILFVKETMSNLESKLGKLIPYEELEKAVEGKLTETELEEAITQLSKSGEIFKPKRGFLQRV